MFCSETKQKQNLCLNNEAEAWKKTSCYCSTHDIAGIGSPVVAPVYKMSCTALEAVFLTNTEAVVPKYMDFCDLKRITVGSWLYRSDELQLLPFYVL